MNVPWGIPFGALWVYLGIPFGVLSRSFQQGLDCGSSESYQSLEVIFRYSLVLHLSLVILLHSLEKEEKIMCYETYGWIVDQSHLIPFSFQIHQLLESSIIKTASLIMQIHPIVVKEKWIQWYIFKQKSLIIQMSLLFWMNKDI